MVAVSIANYYCSLYSRVLVYDINYAYQGHHSKKKKHHV